MTSASDDDHDGSQDGPQGFWNAIGKAILRVVNAVFGRGPHSDDDDKTLERIVVILATFLFVALLYAIYCLK